MSLSIGRTAPLRALLWDFDGTLIDSAPIHRAAFARTMSEFKLPQISYERIAGRPTEDVFAELGLAGKRLGEAVRRKQTLALERLRDAPLLFEGAEEVLCAGRGRGFLMALVSGASRESVTLTAQRYRLERFFDTMICAGDTARAKPYPDPFLEACKRLDVFPAEALAIEDSGSGLASAKAAGIPVCLVHRSGEASKAEADSTVVDLVQFRSELVQTASDPGAGGPSPVLFFHRVRPQSRTGRCVAIVPAAGRGTRLACAAPKILFEINGEPLLAHLHRQLSQVADEVVLVVSPGGLEPIRRCAGELGLRVELAVQPEPVGMADAVWSARQAEATTRADLFLVVWGDQITLRAATVERLMAAHQQASADVSLPTHIMPDPYIHFERDPRGHLIRVLQRREGDSMPSVGETDCGVFLVRNRDFFERLGAYLRDPSDRGARTGEMNFLPFLVAPRSGIDRVCCLRGIDPRETLGVNTVGDAEQAGRYLRELQKEAP